MSDENEVPMPPAVPEAPGATPVEEEKSVSLKVPDSQTGPETAVDSEETPESDADESAETEPGEDTEEDSQAATDPLEGDNETKYPEAGGELPAVPVVSNNPDNQTVTMPDGRVVYTRSHGNPVSNTEQASYELTHYGDQQRYSLVPGDQAYSPYSDPAVPDSHRAQMIEREIAGYGERVLQDPNAPVSSMWDGLHGVYEGQLAHAIATDVGSGNVEA